MTLDISTLRGRDAYQSALDAALQRRIDLNAEADGVPFDAAQGAEFAALSENIEQLEDAITQFDIRDAAIQRSVRSQDPRFSEAPAFNVPNVQRRSQLPENIYDLGAYEQRVRSMAELPALYREGAMRAIEAADFPASADQDKARAQLETVVKRHAKDRNGWVTRHIVATSDPVYLDEYATYIQTAGHQVGRRLAVMQSYSDTDGGLSLPAVIDPSFINISDGSANPMRAISRIVTTTGKTWSAITTAGVVASYRSEATRSTTGAADSAPTDLDNPTVTPAVADTSVDLTMDYLQDYGSAALLGELGTLIADAKDTLEATKFLLGDGTDEPEGIVAAIIADTTSLVTTITDNVFALGDIDKLIGALPNRFRGLDRSKFVANNAIYQLIPSFGTAGEPGNSVYDAQARTLRGYPTYEASAMDDVTTDAKSILLFGDFRQFVIVDRLGLTTKVAEQRDGSGRMTGGTTVYAAWRNGSKVLAFNAFRLLKVQ